MEKTHQDTAQKKIVELLTKFLANALKNNVFSACSVGWFQIDAAGSTSHLVHYGQAGEGKGTSAVSDTTIFDLASLTKPLCTSLCMMALVEEKKINMDDPLDTYFTISGAEHKNITILDLINHSSGLPAHQPYYQKLICLAGDKRRESHLDWILNEKLVYEPGTAHLYSDLGFMLLGRIIEKVSGTTLDAYWRKKIVLPLSLDRELFFSNQQRNKGRIYAITGECGWSKRKLYGVVHDDNCRALGGVAGHAGIFGTARAVISLCANIVMQYQNQIYHPAYGLQTLCRVINNKKGGWRFGFDTPSGAVSSSGKYFSELSIGHLGFTGTSFWLDLQRGIGIVLLTNRVVYGDDLTAIKKLRPLVHNAIMQSLIKKSE